MLQLEESVGKVDIIADGDDDEVSMTGQGMPDGQVDDVGPMTTSERVRATAKRRSTVVAPFLFASNALVTNEVLREGREVLLAKILKHSEDFLEREINKVGVCTPCSSLQRAAFVVALSCVYFRIMKPT